LAALLAIGCDARSAPPAGKGPGTVSAVQQIWTNIDDDKLIESSGIAPVMGTERELFWTHNDGAGKARLFAYDQSGKRQATLEIKTANVVDAEDLAAFTIGKTHYLLLADTGDNDLNRKTTRLIIAAQPQLSELDSAVEEAAANDSGKKGKKKKKKAAFGEQLETPAVAVIDFVYPGGARDVEAVGVDVPGRQILLATKERVKGASPCSIFALPLPFAADGALQPSAANAAPAVAKRIAEVQVPSIVGMTVRPDGQAMLLLGRTYAYEFARQPREDWSKSLAVPPRVLTIPLQKQGESICYGRDGKSLFFTSEGVNQPLWMMGAESYNPKQD